MITLQMQRWQLDKKPNWYEHVLQQRNSKDHYNN